MLPELPDCNLNNLFPYILAYMLSVQLKDINVLFLLGLLHNRHISLMDEHYIHQIFCILLNYQGTYVWKVGFEIATLINTWGYKYKNIYKNLSIPVTSYQQKIKKLAMHLYFKYPA
jgi:hypothetical protein